MPGFNDIQHSVLIVSASEQFDAIVRRSLSDYLMTDFRKSASAARRSVQERYYDMAVINGPLPDEPGERLAAYITQESKASVLLVVPSDWYEDVLERVTDLGVLVLAKPFPRGRLDKALRYLAAMQGRIQALEKEIRNLRERMEENRIVNKAKFLLVEKNHMTEDEAHRWIGKQAMDSGVSRKRIAQRVLEDDE